MLKLSWSRGKVARAFAQLTASVMRRRDISSSRSGSNLWDFSNRARIRASAASYSQKKEGANLEN
jgi:hypothetical protein